MSIEYDLVVLGSGPAGMRAALEGANCGLKVLLIDEQPAPGGQIYRNVLGSGRTVRRLLGHDYIAGDALAKELMESSVDRAFGTTVWDISPELVLTVLSGGATRAYRAKQVIAATGAMERATPIPGWTLPGVLTAGAAQIALKADGSIPSGRVALVGSGPLLLLVAKQLLAAGALIAAVIETSPKSNRQSARKHLLGALRAPAYLSKGAAMFVSLLLHRVPWFRHATNIELLGSERVSTVRFHRGTEVHEVAADTVLLHHGVIPNHQVSRLMRVEHWWNEDQRAWNAVCDELGQTSHPGFRMAGDGVAIAGAVAAESSGALAALGAAHSLGRISDAELNAGKRRWKDALSRHRSVRPFLDALYRPADWVCSPPDAVTVCRCEDVTAGEVRRMADIGCIGPNQTKFFSRCGMGPCQGRVCGNVVSQILSERLKSPMNDVGAYRVRAPLKPLPLQAIANFSNSDRNL
ncbi:MAG: FAD-binding protein [Hyphomicrobiales bacterium]|nr:MAG: FAD-binding protein [Hyphomicrobiales bacterium]